MALAQIQSRPEAVMMLLPGLLEMAADGMTTSALPIKRLTPTSLTVILMVVVAQMP